ncbi:MAG: glycoside hydrolase family 43 protein [Bacteroidales bacterium]
MIRKYFLALFASSLLLVFNSGKEVYLFSSFREPATDGLYLAWSQDGYHWNDLGGPYLKPEVGNQKLMRDPSVIRGPEGIYHMVWTSSWKGDFGFGYASSKDLIHWSEQKLIPVMQNEPTTVNVWAPELFYDDEQKQYIIVWASTIPFRFEKGEEEELNNHRLYYTATKDFSTFSETKLFLDPVFSVIDATIVKRGKGDYVLIMKDNTRQNRNLRVGFSDKPLGPYTDISKTFTQMYTEGPSAVRIKNDWLIYFDAYREKKYGAVKTSDFKSFTDVSDEIILPVGHKHGTIFKADGKTVKTLIKAYEKKFAMQKVNGGNKGEK